MSVDDRWGCRVGSLVCPTVGFAVGEEMDKEEVSIALSSSKKEMVVGLLSSLTMSSGECPCPCFSVNSGRASLPSIAAEDSVVAVVVDATPGFCCGAPVDKYAATPINTMLPTSKAVAIIMMVLMMESAWVIQSGMHRTLGGACFSAW